MTYKNFERYKKQPKLRIGLYLLLYLRYNKEMSTLVFTLRTHCLAVFKKKLCFVVFLLQKNLQTIKAEYNKRNCYIRSIQFSSASIFKRNKYMQPNIRHMQS